MSLLSKNTIAKCRCTIWRTSCFQDPQRKVYVLNNNPKQIASKSPLICKTVSQMCRYPLSSNLMLWTQIRFQNDYPKLHRDMEFPSFDAYRKEKFKDVNKTSWHSGDEKYGYTYVVGYFGFLYGMYCLKTELIHDLSCMGAPADVIALASIEVSIANIAPGKCNSYKWRGKPLFIKHRSQKDILAERDTPLSALKDPQTPEQRTIKPEWLIVIGICTHLGCVPVANSGDFTGGFYCPCHGSHFDNIGRARKGPAPTNLEIPPYKFISDTLLLFKLTRICKFCPLDWALTRGECQTELDTTTSCDV